MKRKATQQPRAETVAKRQETPEKIRQLKRLTRADWSAQKKKDAEKASSSSAVAPPASSQASMSESDRIFFENMARQRRIREMDPFPSAIGKLIPVCTIVGGKVYSPQERPFWSRYTRDDWRSAMIRQSLKNNGYRSIFSTLETIVDDEPKSVDEENVTKPTNKSAKPSSR